MIIPYDSAFSTFHDDIVQYIIENGYSSRYKIFYAVIPNTLEICTKYCSLLQACGHVV